MDLRLAFLCSLTPALYGWLTGRRLISDASGPALAERLEARREGSKRVMVVAWSAIVFLGGWHTGWLLPLSVLFQLVGNFPSRRAVLGETWGLGAFLGHNLRFIFVMAGPWIGILAAAFLPVSSRSIFAVTAGAWFAVLTWLALHTASTARWLFRTRPIVSGELTPLLGTILDRATCARPDVVSASAPGGNWINAFAIGGSRPLILMTEGLLEVLEPQETVAILAHEVGHLEEFGRWRWQLRLLVPIALAVMYAVAVVALIGRVSFTPLFVLGWPGALIIGGVVMGRGSRDRETAADLRAVELCGNGAALASALTKLHESARLPRRQARGVERRATHPSLARRLQAIGHSASVEADTCEFEPVLIRDARDTHRAVALLQDRVDFLEGLATTHDRPHDASLHATSATSILFSEVRELRLAPGVGGLHLRCVRKGSKLPRIRVADRDVGRVQFVLDSIDSSLAEG